MNRALIFLASLVLTFVTISSASGATPMQWAGKAVGTHGECHSSGGHAGAGWLAVTPSTLISPESIGL